MGQKVNPHGLRVGVIADWDSNWYAESDFADNLVEDYNIRKFLQKKLYSSGVSKIEIERAADKVKVTVHTDGGMLIVTGEPGVMRASSTIEQKHNMYVTLCQTCHYADQSAMPPRCCISNS